MMQDVDRVLAEVASQVVEAGLDLESVREVLVAHILGEQPLPLGNRTAPPEPVTAEPRRFFPE
jgi:hypothetical protein